MITLTYDITYDLGLGPVDEKITFDTENPFANEEVLVRAALMEKLNIDIEDKNFKLLTWEPTNTTSITNNDVFMLILIWVIIPIISTIAGYYMNRWFFNFLIKRYPNTFIPKERIGKRIGGIWPITIHEILPEKAA